MKIQQKQNIPVSSIIWGADGVPVSQAFDDVYFSRESGLAESRYVFIQGNHLPERWQQAQVLTIAEAGFGTGLNFLSTWQAWDMAPAPKARLDYIAVEYCPLAAHELQRVYGLWPELLPYAQVLLAEYPPVWQGSVHTLVLADGAIELTLIGRDIMQALEGINTPIDAWFLDGFSPAKNPQMWSRQVLDGIAQHTAPGGTFATYTAAGCVRRDAQAAGFIVEKIPGFGKKRHMLRGVLKNNPYS